MELQLLETLGKIAGIGGIALGVSLLLFRETLRKAVLPKLTRDQGYRIITLSLVLVWFVAVAGIAGWVWVETTPRTQASGAGSVVTHGDGSPVIQGVGGDVNYDGSD